MWRYWLAALLMAVMVWPSAAQDAEGDAGDGQFCVRAYEDLDGTGARDAGDPFIQSGVIVNLQDAAGIVIDSQRMEDSPSRGQGLICFRGLAAGQYSVFVTTSLYSATTPDNMTATLGGGQLPALLEFGGQRIESEVAVTVTTTTTATDDSGAIRRVLVAAAGALAAMLVIGLIGVIVFWLIVRPRTSPTNITPPVDPDAPFRPPPERRRQTQTTERDQPPDYDTFQDF